MRVGDRVVHATEHGDVVGIAIIVDRTTGTGDTVAVDEREEAIDGIRRCAEPRAGGVVSRQQRWQQIFFAPTLHGAEEKESILDDRKADAGAELILVVSTAERARGATLLHRQVAIATDVRQRTLNDVRSAARGLRHLATGELTACNVVGIGDDACSANRVLRHEAGGE